MNMKSPENGHWKPPEARDTLPATEGAKRAATSGLDTERLIEILTDQVCDQITESLEAVGRAIERRIILRVLGKTGGNQTEAAKLLGLRRTTLSYRMKCLGISSKRARRWAMD